MLPSPWVASERELKLGGRPNKNKKDRQGFYYPFNRSRPRPLRARRLRFFRAHTHALASGSPGPEPAFSPFTIPASPIALAQLSLGASVCATGYRLMRANDAPTSARGASTRFRPPCSGRSHRPRGGASAWIPLAAELPPDSLPKVAPSYRSGTSQRLIISSVHRHR